MSSLRAILLLSALLISFAGSNGRDIAAYAYGKSLMEVKEACSADPEMQELCVSIQEYAVSAVFVEGVLLTYCKLVAENKIDKDAFADYRLYIL